MNTLKELKNNWNEFGKTIPFVAILNSPGKKHEGWNVKDFFQTGVDEIQIVTDYLEKFDLLLSGRKAMDFGCGAGRLTQALAKQCSAVVGIDISKSMIGLARKYNIYTDNCSYMEISDDNLSFLENESIDFIYSNIVLQHIAPEFSTNYIKEFLRILNPGGLILFQLPAKKIVKKRSAIKRIVPEPIYNLTYKIRDLIRYLRRGKQPVMEMHCIPKNEILELVKCHGGETIDIVEDQSAGLRYEGYRYLVRKL